MTYSCTSPQDLHEPVNKVETLITDFRAKPSKSEGIILRPEARKSIRKRARQILKCTFFYPFAPRPDIILKSQLLSCTVTDTASIKQLQGSIGKYTLFGSSIKFYASTCMCTEFDFVTHIHYVHEIVGKRSGQCTGCTQDDCHSQSTR